MRTLLVLLVFAATLFTSENAVSASLLDATLSYSAVCKVTVDGRSYTGKVFHVAGRERDEQTVFGIPEVVIINDASDKGWLIVPMMKTFVEFPLPPVMVKLADRNLKMTRVAYDHVDGVPATKYYVDTTSSDGTKAKGFLWYTRQDVLIKLQGVVVSPHGHRSTIAMQLSHLQEGPQNRSLFTVPRGFTRLPADALMPLLGRPLSATSN